MNMNKNKKNVILKKIKRSATQETEARELQI